MSIFFFLLSIQSVSKLDPVDSNASTDFIAYIQALITSYLNNCNVFLCKIPASTFYSPKRLLEKKKRNWVMSD